MFFKHHIENWESWSQLFQSITVWQPLIEAIYQREGLSCNTIGQLTPGTNAVFRVDQTVIKIFAPKVVGFYDDFHTELTALSDAKSLGVAVPKIIAHGVIEDRYSFDYLILSYIPGSELGDILHTSDIAQQDYLLRQIKEMVQAMQRGNSYQQGMDFLLRRAMHNERWSIYNADVRQEVHARLNQFVPPSRLIRVHGDMTGDNLLLDEQRQVYLIDFADSCVAPPEYEYPALIFELFDMDTTLTQRFFEYADSAIFIAMLFPFILLHDFGAHYLRKAVERLLCCSADQVSCLTQLEEALVKHFRHG